MDKFLMDGTIGLGGDRWASQAVVGYVGSDIPHFLSNGVAVAHVCVMCEMVCVIFI